MSLSLMVRRQQKSEIERLHRMLTVRPLRVLFVVDHASIVVEPMFHRSTPNNHSLLNTLRFFMSGGRSEPNPAELRLASKL
jgi:hypothetical protein